jgi:plasmid rolling circle replication initiator protein Rep
MRGESHLPAGLQPSPSLSDSSEIGLILSELSPKDKPWDKHRAMADRIEGYYANSEFSKYGERISICSMLLDFKLVTNIELGELVLKLSSAHFCHCRHCPVCQWRRSLMWRAKFYQVLPKVLEDYRTHRWLRLTLTIRNPELVDLRFTIDHLNESFKRMSKRKAFPGVGWIKSLEVTKSETVSVNGVSTAHPHFHILMMVKPSYFSGKAYLSFTAWTELWKSCLRVDYDPQLNIQVVPKTKNLLDCLPEMVKYQVKESDLVDDRDWFLELNKQLHKTRAIEIGGVLKPYLKALENEPEDLIGKDLENDSDIDEGHLVFGWFMKEKHYKKVGER